MVQPFADPCGRGVIEAQPCPGELRREIPARRRRVVLAACVLASSMALIDGSVLTVALPKLRAALDADLASVQWVINSYLLALAALTLIGGALADAYGKARMLSIGCLLFGAASGGCALAPSLGWLIGVGGWWRARRDGRQRSPQGRGDASFPGAAIRRRRSNLRTPAETWRESHCICP
jgi:MFS family permease